MGSSRNLAIGGVRQLDGVGTTRAFELPTNDLLTHARVVGMTGSGETGLLILTFPSMSAEEFAPWMDEGMLARSGQTRHEAAEAEA